MKNKTEIKKRKCIVFTGGGTGGHIMPNLALIEVLKKRYDIYYIGSHDGQEKKLVTTVPFLSITTVKFKRSLSLSNLLIPFKLCKGIKEAKELLKKLNPVLIFSKGGFVSVPVALAGAKLKIPVITHESDLSLGLANKLIKNKCKYVCTSFESTKNTVSNGVYTGTPIRSSIFNGNADVVLKRHKLDINKKTILIVGGSSGSKTINEAVFKILNDLKNYNVIHIVGKNNINKKIEQTNYVQLDFATDIENYFAAADMVITRGGSNALFELLALKKPMLIIPLSTKNSRGDQILNANYFAEKGYANVLMEDNINNLLLSSIEKTLKDSKKLIQNMNINTKNGTKEIINLIENTIRS